MTNILKYSDRQLSKFLLHSIREIMQMLALKSKLMVSSSLDIHPDLNYAHYLIKKEVMKGPGYGNLIFGNISSLQADPSSIEAASFAKIRITAAPV